jgi:predicted nucleic acid-binding protein
VTTTYFDASALVKLVKREHGAQEAAAAWAAARNPHASRLAMVEVRAALGAAHRNHALPDEDLHMALDREQHLRTGIVPIELTESIESNARELVARHALSGADAVHLASALALEDPQLVFATWDRRLHGAAQAEGLHVVPATLDR